MNEDIENIDFEELSDEPNEGSTTLVKRDTSLIGHVAVDVSVNVGELSIDVESLFNLKSGDVLTLNESVDEPLTLVVDGKPIAKGYLVAVGDCFGVQIVETAD